MRWFLPVVLAASLLVGCEDFDRSARILTGGDVAEGGEAIRRHGCGSCHTIPGIPGAKGLVGPSLAQLRNGLYIAGGKTNTPEHLIAFIRDPHATEVTVMPNTGVSEAEARDIAAYLYSIR